MALHPWRFVFGIAIFVLKSDVKLQLVPECMDIFVLLLLCTAGVLLCTIYGERFHSFWTSMYTSSFCSSVHACRIPASDAGVLILSIVSGEGRNDDASGWLGSASKRDLVVPRTRLKLGERAFRVAAPWLWNELPPDIRKSSTLATFKKHLKTFIL